MNNTSAQQAMKLEAKDLLAELLRNSVKQEDTAQFLYRVLRGAGRTPDELIAMADRLGGLAWEERRRN